MRRALTVAAAAVPAAVLAALSAGSGQVIEIDNFNTVDKVSYVNLAQCEGKSGVVLEWNIVPIAGATFTTTGTYRIFASNTAPDTSPTAGANLNFCPEANDTTKSPSVFAGQVDSVSVTGSVQQKSVVAVDIAARANLTCDPASEGQPVWVCSHWYDATAQRKGFASGKFLIQVAAPNAPTGVTAGSGDGRLVVDWTESTGGQVSADHYVAQATGGGTTTLSASIDVPPVTISGLTNGTTYEVRVVAYSVAGNPSTASDPATGTPMPAADFWETYKARGGIEAGGCSSGPAGSLALLGAASLLAVRRRKP